jgi:hypothetical protein
MLYSIIANFVMVARRVVYCEFRHGCKLCRVNSRCIKICNANRREYGTHHSYVLVVHTLRVAENEILKLDLPAKRHY